MIGRGETRLENRILSTALKTKVVGFTEVRREVAGCTS